MPDIPNADEIAKLASLLAPGILILGVRGRFRDAAPPSFADKTVNYALVSVAYSAAAYPIFHAEGWVELPSWLWNLLLSFVLPLLVGALFVFFDRSEHFYKLTDWLGLNPVHHVPTAWDFAFRKRQPSFALIHLTDGSEVAGAWINGSFASSISSDRDVYLALMYQVGEDGNWVEVVPNRSILICGGSVRMVEFINGGFDE